MALVAVTAPRWRRLLVALMPIAIPAWMRLVFASAVRRFGRERGYQAGFAVYWATCWGFAAIAAGPGRLTPLWNSRTTPLVPTPRPLAWAALSVPPAGAITTQLLPHACRAGWPAVMTAAGIGITNGFAEEVLWRGLPVAIYPHDPVRGWLIPAVGFTAWHVIPLSAAGTPPHRRAAILLGAAAIGLGNGWIAFRTRSLRAVLISHAITDSCGVDTVRARWPVGLPVRR